MQKQRLDWTKALLAGLALSWGSSGAFAQDATQMEAGEALYATNCAVCHKPGGEGQGSTIPALKGDENLSDAYMIVYNVHEGVVVMPAFPALDDADIAAVASYVRNAWGNAYGPVTAEEVATMRADLTPPGPIRSIWDGVFTAEQAERGKAVFNSPCGACHGSRLNGAPDDMDQTPAPPLARVKFLRSWDGRSLGSLFSYTKTTMPKSNPGFLPEEDYVAIVAYMLSLSGAPAGDTPLSTDVRDLAHIMIGEKP
jgi:mono/diheme cytochrome c family protein